MNCRAPSDPTHILAVDPQTMLAFSRLHPCLQDVPPLRCAVLISGGPSRDPAHAHLYTPHQHQQRQRQQLQSKHASHNPNGEQGASAAGSSQGSPHPQAAALHTAAAQTEHHTSPDGQGSTPSHGPLNQSAHTNGANGWNPGSSGGGGAEAAAGGTAAQDSHGHDRQPHHHHHHQHHRQDHAALLRPTCHLVGLADALRPRSEELVGYCHQPLVLRHRQGTYGRVVGQGTEGQGPAGDMGTRTEGEW